VPGDNNVSVEITIRLIEANRYFGLRNLAYITATFQEDKNSHIYKTPVRPVLKYSAKTWTITKKR
jgi:hypothetical protein